MKIPCPSNSTKSVLSIPIGWPLVAHSCACKGSARFGAISTSSSSRFPFPSSHQLFLSIALIQKLYTALMVLQSSLCNHETTSDLSESKGELCSYEPPSTLQNPYASCPSNQYDTGNTGSNRRLQPHRATSTQSTYHGSCYCDHNFAEEHSFQTTINQHHNSSISYLILNQHHGRKISEEEEAKCYLYGLPQEDGHGG